MNSYLDAFKNFGNLQGRTRRKDYWMFAVVTAVVAFVLGMIDGIIGIQIVAGTGILSGIYALAVLIPTFSIAVRRLHDIGKSAWWLLLSFVPVIGWIALFVFMVMPGTQGANQYGEDPKANYTR